jgi:hypothetical protein
MSVPPMSLGFGMHTFNHTAPTTPGTPSSATSFTSGANPIFLRIHVHP